MGRGTKVSFRYLELRPESGSYSYRRKLRPEIAEKARGEVERSWSGRPARIGGKGAVKIGLNTTDVAVAMQRWGEVHGQVEQIVSGAYDQVVAKRTSRLRSGGPVLRNVLRDQDFSVVGAQVEREVLARVEKGQWDRRERLSDIGLELLARDAGEKPGPAALRNASLSMHDREAGMYRAYQQTIRDAVATGLIDSSGRELAPIEPDGALDWALAFMVEDVRAYFADQGAELAPNHPDLVRIGLSVMRAKEKAHAKAYAMYVDGDIAAAPEAPETLPALAREQEQQGTKLSEAFERWRQQMRPSDKTAGDYLAYVNRFISLIGDLPVRAISRANVREFRDLMRDFPRTIPLAKRHLSAKALIAWAKSADIPRLSVTTVNDKAVGALSAIIAAVADDESIESNPCDRQKLKVDERDVQERLPYDSEDLRRLLTSSLYGPGAKIPRAAGGAAAPWIPLIAMFAGARLEEIGQLRCWDIREQDGVWMFDLATLDNTPGQTTQRKTGSSRRLVPVHPELVRLGLLTYSERRKQAGGVRLFPELAEYRGKITTSWSKWWGRWARKHISEDTAKCFHSFRHLFKDRLVLTKCDEFVMMRLLGHSVPGMTKNYGRIQVSPEKIQEAMAAVAYPELADVLSGLIVAGEDKE